MAKKNKKNKLLVYYCPYDETQLKTTRSITVTYQGEWSLPVSLMICTTCGKEFSGINEFPHMKPVKIGGVKYINLKSGVKTAIKPTIKTRVITNSRETHEIMNSIKVRVYYPNCPTICVCGTPLIKKKVYVLSNKGNEIEMPLDYCDNCGIYYAEYGIYASRKRKFNVLNEEELQVIKGHFQKRNEQKQEKARKKAERKAREEAERQRHILEEKERKEREEREQRERLRKEKEEAERNKSRLEDNQIYAKDFVVRRTTFKCMHNDHILQNIDAVVDVIDRHGNIRHVMVAAGYCQNCNIFFIMESAYEKLKLVGVPICRMTEEKVYLKGSAFMNGMKLAQESILMQYGYNVNVTEGLSSTQRKKILAVLIDNKILTKSEIISYLDFFINQRKNQKNMEKAINKWEDDKEFVLEYNNGSYQQYGVRGIYRPY